MKQVGIKGISEESIISNAKFSDCKRYRYTLLRMWEVDKEIVSFIGLNPSTADEVNNDPTVRRCINYAKDWGFGGMYMLNLFAIRATDPRVMLTDSEPIGSDNTSAICECATLSAMVVACWGNHGRHLHRSQHVAEVLYGLGIPLNALSVTKCGEPGHPLYLKSSLKPVEYDYFASTGKTRGKIW